MSIDAYDYGKQDGIEQERLRLADLFRTHRCQCLDMTFEQLEELQPDPKKRFFEHANCDFVGLDWVIEQIEKGE